MIKQAPQIVNPPGKDVVVAVVTRLVGEAAADMIRHDAAMAGGKGFYQIAVIERP